MKNWTYDAFISYRHAELDKFVAENLHRQLEAFRLPKSVVQKMNHSVSGECETEVRTRIRRVFRDKDELPLTNNLEDPIRKALAESEYLIVICSPRLRESIWCKKEIETFISMHGRDKIFAVLVEGEPEESFPDELLSWEETVTRPDGSTEVVKHLMEPLAADVRGKDKRTILKAMRTEILRLLAPMFGVRYDDLRQRHRERRMRRILSASLTVAAVCLVFGAVSTSMALHINRQKEQIVSQNEELFNQQEQIQAQNEQLMRNQALSLAQDSLDRLDKGDHMGAIQLAVQALTEYEGIEMPYTAEAQYALTESLYVYDCRTSLKPQYQFQTKGIISYMKVSPDRNLLLTCDASEGLILWDVNTRKRITEFPDNGMISESYCTFVGSDKVAYISRENGVEIYEVSTGKTIPLGENYVSSLFSDAEGRYLAMESLSGVLFYDGQTLESIGSCTLPEGVWVTNLPSAPIDHLECLPISYKLDDQYYLCFWDVLEGVSRTVWKLEGDFSPTVQFNGDTAYVLSNAQKEDWRFDAHLWACNYKTGEVYWKKTFENAGGDQIYLPGAQDAENFLFTSNAESHLIRFADGEEVARFALGSSVVGGTTFPESDLFATFTRSGEFHITSGSSMLNYAREDMLESHSKNVKDFKVSSGGFLILPYQDNRITMYNYFVNEDAVEFEGDIPASDEPVLEYSDAVDFAQEKGLERAALTRYVFEVPEKGLTILWYTDSTLEIYNKDDMTLVASFSDIQDAVNHYYGKDKDGNLYIGGSIYAYILNGNYEILGRIERLRAVNAEENCLVQATVSGDLRQIPIRSLEDLLVKAQEYVLQ